MRADDGFTLIELLVAMVASLVIAGTLMTFLIFTIDQQNAVSSQGFTTRQAETGLAQLQEDLRAAENNPVAVSATWPLGNRTPVVITYTTGATAQFTASFYTAPTGGCDGTTGASGLPCNQVTWSCTAAAGAVPGACTRTCVAPTAALAAGQCTVAGADHAVEISGLSSATITPCITGGATTACKATGTAIPTAVSGTPPGSPPSFPSFVNLSFSLETISQSDTGGTHTVPGSSLVPLEGGVNLRNWS